MQQALDATSGLIGNVLLRWAEAPQPVTREFVAQVARSHPAIVNTRRFAAEPLELAGRSIAQGDALVLQLGGAGLGFGAGVHECPGRSLSMAIAAAAAAYAVTQRSEWKASAWRPLPNARIPVFAA